MKKLMKLRYFLIAAIILTFAACDDDEYYYDDPPSPPQNIEVFVDDDVVEIQWDFNRESDIAGYNVYYNYTYEGEYTLIGSTDKNVNYFVDYEAVNGEKYFYAVAAYDENNNESELSYDEVYGVPRPQGLNQSVMDYIRFPNSAGYDFSEYLVGPYNEVSDDFSADFFFENYEGTYYLNVWDNSEIQDMGATDNIYDIAYAPISGWVPLVEGENVKYTEAKVGHTYVISTWDFHFAKIRITSMTSERIFFDWAYQLIENERQLKRGAAPEKRNDVPNKVIKNN